MTRLRQRKTMKAEENERRFDIFDPEPSKHPWGDPSDMCLLIQKKVHKINTWLLARRLTKHTHALDGRLPIPKE